MGFFDKAKKLAKATVEVAQADAVVVTTPVRMVQNTIIEGNVEGVLTRLETIPLKQLILLMPALKTLRDIRINSESLSLHFVLDLANGLL